MMPTLTGCVFDGQVDPNLTVAHGMDVGVLFSHEVLNGQTLPTLQNCTVKNCGINGVQLLGKEVPFEWITGEHSVRLNMYSSEIVNNGYRADDANPDDTGHTHGNLRDEIPTNPMGCGAD
jgi:hypothetical protein